MGLFGGDAQRDPQRFADRVEAGARLGQALAATTLVAPVVLGLPRGGVPVAAEVAAALSAPLDVLVVRKIGAPGQPELAVGAVAEGAEPVFDDDLIRRLGLTRADLAATVEAERIELARRLEHYRAGRPAHEVAGATAVVVDDGLATGSSALSAVRAVAARRPSRIVLAVPVAARESVERLRPEVDDLVVVSVPAHFLAVGRWYADFAQTTDEQVVALLAGSRPPDDPG